VVPEAANPQMHELTATFGKEVQRVVKEYLDAMEKVRLKAGLKAAMNASSLGNLYLQVSLTPAFLHMVAPLWQGFF
jgi:methionyl-tRNA synthetase